MAVLNSTPRPAPFGPDERQQEAIEHVLGPMLVVAGAGTGKTTVLTRRIARLIHEGHARPDEILALTYTDNAAQEMRQRVASELEGTDCSRLQAKTFHAYCFEVLERCGQKFAVLDDKDLWIYLRRRIRELRLNYFVRAANLGQFLDDLLNFMRRCQDELVEPEKYAEYVGRLERGELPIPRVSKSKDALSDEEVLGRCREIAGVFATVERMLREEKLGTFGHMITRAYELLRQDAGLLARERGRARFLLVDEFQDANFAQVKILERLAGEERNVFAVGDPDQAIYRFRGASSAAFDLFLRQFPDARFVALGKNRRSTTPILRCAHELIAKNPPIFAGAHAEALRYQRAPLQSAREEAAAREGRELPSLPVEAVVLNDKDAESADLVNIIVQRRGGLQCDWKNFAVLYRTHSHRDQVAEELAQRQIPYAIENMDVMDTPEVRDLLACLGAVVSPTDGASLFRVAALPQFGIDPEKLSAAMKAAPRETGLASILERTDGGRAILCALREVRDEIAQAGAKSRAALDIILRHFTFARSSPPLNAVLEFVSDWESKAITRTGEIGELLEYLEYFREARGSITLASRDEDAVRLMTAHAAKGLEFDHVFILRANSGSFPFRYREPLVEFPRDLRDPDSVVPDEGKELHEQEERRLFYVAMTRARDSLAIYAKQGRGRDLTPPGFLRDLLKDASLGRWLLRRNPPPLQVDLSAQAEGGPLPLSNVAAWLSMKPGMNPDSRLSATALETYETCPLQFKLEREWKIPREAPAAMQYGAAMHRVLRSYYDGVRFQRPLADLALLELFRTDLAEAGIQDRYQHELYEKQGLEQLRDFLAAARQTPAPEVLHTEQEFQVRIGEASVAGRMDRVDRGDADRVVIVDYKTGKPRSQQDADDSLQLSIYALAASEKWGYNTERLVFHNLEDNSSVVTTRDAGQLEEARAKVEEVAEKIAAGEFPANPNYHCRWCPYYSLCPATEKRLYSAPSAENRRSRSN